MTICALLFRDSFPIAITDNLISNKSGIKDLSTPLIENENRKGLNGYKPAGVANKIWKITINDDINHTYYMMYSGNVNDALELSNYIKGKLAYQTVDEIDVLDIENYIINSKLEISVILMYMDKDGYFSHYYVNAHKISLGKIDSILAIGSGVSDFGHEVQNLYLKNSKLIDKITHLNIQEKILTSLLLVSQLTSDYLYLDCFSSFARKSCGALYNIYTFPQLYYNSISEIPNFIKNGICQIFIDFCFIQNNFFIKRIVHTRQCYESDEILSTTIDLNEKIPNDDIVKINKGEFRKRVHIIRSLKDDSFLDNPNKLSLYSNQVIIYASVGMQNTKTIHYLPNDSHKIISIKYSNSELEIKLDYMNEENFFTRISKRVLQPLILPKQKNYNKYSPR